jgi:hypothetical protein
MLFSIQWGAVLVGLGALLAGLGSVLSGWAALTLARKGKDAEAGASPGSGEPDAGGDGGSTDGSMGGVESGQPADADRHD